MAFNGGAFAKVTGSFLTASPAIISNIDVISGRHLTFRYLAHNVHGWSEPSDEFVIVAATIPAVPTDAATQSTFVESYMILKWTEPTFTGGDLVAIEEYRV